jgi:hypothetical protein
MAENDDLRIVCHKIDALGQKFDKMEDKLDKNIQSSGKRLREIEKVAAVLEKGVQAISTDVDNLQEKSNRNDVLVVIGNVIVVAAASVANALGLRE